MPIPVSRPSLTTTLDQRYATQKAGGAFDVKKTLGAPGTAPTAQAVIEGDTVSMNGNQFQSPNGFETDVLQGQTQLKDAQGTTSKELSRHIKGFSNKKYKP
jgi:hypothetical protein